MGDGRDATFWEGVATTRWGSYISEIERRAVFAANDACPQPGLAVEVGAEGGRWSRILGDRGWRLICTHVDAAALKACASAVPEATCIVVAPDEDRIPAETGSAQLLLTIEVPPVIHSDWFAPEAARILAEKGLVVGVHFNRFSVRGALLGVRNRLKGANDVYGSRYGDWRRRLVEHGFEMVREDGCCWFPFKRDSDSVLVPFFVGIEKWLGLRKLARVSPWIVFVARRTADET